MFFSMVLEVRQRLHLELNDAAAAAEITAEVLGASGGIPCQLYVTHAD